MTTCDNRGADDGGMKTVEPMVATIVATVVALATTPPPPPLTVMPATPRGPLYLDPWTGTIQMCLILGGGVDVQQPLPLAMLVGALIYGLPP
jgi:hypothetical protein